MLHQITIIFNVQAAGLFVVVATAIPACSCACYILNSGFVIRY